MSKIDMSRLLDLNAVKVIQNWVQENFISKSDTKTLGAACKLRITFGEDFIGQTYTVAGENEHHAGVVPEERVVEIVIDDLECTYTVTCPNDEGTEYSCEIVVGNYYGRYFGTINGFRAYLHIKAEAGATVTATIGDKSYTGTAGEDGYCTLTVKRIGTYSVTATLDEQTSSAVTAEAGETADATVEVTCAAIPKVVSWSKGTDSEIAEAIDKARNGELNLQTDLNWKVGDTRTIKISAFDGANASHAEQDIDIVISSFSDYNSCGAIMQFDFKDALVTAEAFHSSGINEYENSDLYKTTLPALANALPTWLTSRLLEFNISVEYGGIGTSTFANKLAIRTYDEIDKESNTRIAYYKSDAEAIKKRGHNGSADEWWTRTHYGSDCFGVMDSSAIFGAKDVTMTAGIAPFGCL